MAFLFFCLAFFCLAAETMINAVRNLFMLLLTMCRNQSGNRLSAISCWRRQKLRIFAESSNMSGDKRLQMLGNTRGIAHSLWDDGLLQLHDSPNNFNSLPDNRSPIYP